MREVAITLETFDSIRNASEGAQISLGCVQGCQSREDAIILKMRSLARSLSTMLLSRLAVWERVFFGGGKWGARVREKREGGAEVCAVW